MAAGRLPAPGTEYGPCDGQCGHRDCIKTREMAKSICPSCKKPIGYGASFCHYQDDLWHASCLEDFVEATR